MKIERKNIKKPKILTIKDLRAGTVFESDHDQLRDHICLKGHDYEWNRGRGSILFLDSDNANGFTDNGNNFDDAPCRVLNAKLVIEE